MKVTVNDTIRCRWRQSKRIVESIAEAFGKHVEETAKEEQENDDGGQQAERQRPAAPQKCGNKGQ